MAAAAERELKTERAESDECGGTLLHPDGPETAKEAGLRYVTDARPGIRREKHGDGFTYFKPGGERIEEERTLERIRSLGIPPAWTDVWICPLTNGHIQATGRDAKGRKQYRYHPRWRAVRDSNKYDRLLAFGEALPELRRRVNEEFSRPGLSREKILATTIQLLETTLIRVGNEEYARENGSYGLTTLHNEHVDVSGSTVRFHFRGKSGKEWEVAVRDRRLARVIRRCQELPGQELFQYPGEDGELHAISSCDVNSYLRDVTGMDFTAKDFRTWAGTVQAYVELSRLTDADTEREAKHDVVVAIQTVSERLGNTPAVCRKCYVHPALLEAYQDPERRSLLAQCLEADHAGSPLPREEAALLCLLRCLSGADANDAAGTKAA